MSSRGLVVASPPRRRGPQVRANWYYGSHGAVDVVRPVAPPSRESGRGDSGVYTDRRKWPLGAVLYHSCTLLRCYGQTWERRSVHRSAKTASRCRFGAFVYTVATLVATRVASGGTSAPTAMVCRRRPLGGRLPLGRENRPCASDAVARLAFSPRQQSTQTSEEPLLAYDVLSPATGGCKESWLHARLDGQALAPTWQPGYAAVDALTIRAIHATMEV